MWYKIGIIVILLIIYLILDSLEHSGKLSMVKSKNYIIFSAAILLILQSGLRNVAVGPDTYAYYLKFQDCSTETWSDIISNFKTVYVEGEGKDAGYYLIQKLFSSVIPNFQCFLVFIAVIFFWSFFEVVGQYTNSKKEVLIAVIVYLALFYSFFSITGCRQVLATSLCLFSVKYIRERKLLPFIVIMIIAFFIHRSSMIFVPFYYISRLSKPGYLYVVGIVLIPYLISVSHKYTSQLAIISGSDTYLAYAEESGIGATTFLWFYITITTFLFVIQRKMIAKDNDDILVYNAIYLALFFLPLTYSSAALMRIVQYESLFLTIGISFFLRKNISSRQSGLVTIFFVVSMLAMGYKIITTDVEYKFYWQYMELPMNYL